MSTGAGWCRARACTSTSATSAAGCSAARRPSSGCTTTAGRPRARGRSWTTICGARPLPPGAPGVPAAGGVRGRRGWAGAGLRRQRGAGVGGRVALRPLRAGRRLSAGRDAGRGVARQHLDAAGRVRRWPSGSALGQTTHGAVRHPRLEAARASRATAFPALSSRKWRGRRPRCRVRREGGKAIFESDAFAWRVCLDLEGEQALPDNFFDLLPGVPTVLDWPAALGPRRCCGWGTDNPRFS